MDVNVFGVVGAGQMGNGIAHVAAASGLDVIMNDVKQEFVDKGLKTIEKNLDRAISKGKMTAEGKSAILGRIKPSVDLQDFERADFVVEAIIENLGLKKQVFEKLDQVMAPGRIIASNTSSISITKLAACTNRPEKFIGMHFMNPVPIMKLVEVINGLATESETTKLTLDVEVGRSSRLGRAIKIEFKPSTGLISKPNLC